MEINESFWTAISAALPRELIDAPQNHEEKLPPIQDGENVLGELNEGEKNLFILACKCEQVAIGYQTKKLEIMKELAPFPPNPIMMMEKIAKMGPAKKQLLESYGEKAEAFIALIQALKTLMWKSIEARLGMFGKSLSLREGCRIVRIKGFGEMLEELLQGAQDVSTMEKEGLARTVSF